MDGIEALLAPSIEDQLRVRGDPLSLRAAVLIQDLRVQDTVFHEQNAKLRGALVEAADLAIDVISTVVRAGALHRIYYRHGDKSIGKWAVYLRHAKEMVPRLNQTYALSIRGVYQVRKP